MYEVKLHKDSNDIDGTRIHYSNTSKIKLISGTVAQGINVVDSFNFTMNMSNPAYTILNNLKTLITVKNTITGKTEFDGYVSGQDGTMDEEGKYTKEVRCVSVFNYLKQSLSGYGEYHNMTPSAFFQLIIDFHNTQVEPHKQFVVRNVDVTNTTDNLYRYTNQESTTFDTIMEKLVDRLGGEIRVERVDGKLYIDWLKTVGEVKEKTEIRVGKNLKSAERNEDTDNIYSRWMIYGSEIEKEDNENVAEGDAYAAKERITIASVNGGKPYLDDPIAIAQWGIVVGHKTFDGVTNKDILKTKGQNFITNNKLITISNQLTALDLSLIGKDIDSFEVYNWYPLNNPALAAKENVRIIEKRIDIISPQSSSLTLGDTYLTASKYQAALKKNQQAYEKIKGTVDSLMKSNISLGMSVNKAKAELESIKDSLVGVDITNLPTELQGIANQLLAMQQTLTDIEAGFDAIPVHLPVNSTTDGLMRSVDYMFLKSIVLATPLVDGLMSKEDKVKLDSISVAPVVT